MTPQFTFHGPGPKPTPPEGGRISWIGIRDDLLDHAKAHPGEWLLITRSAPSKSPYTPGRVRANPAFNEIRIESFARKAIPQKNGSRFDSAWEIWMRVAPVQKLIDEARTENRARADRDVRELVEAARKNREKEEQ